LGIYRFSPKAKIGNGLEITPTSGSGFAENGSRLESANQLQFRDVSEKNNGAFILH